jgi:hypothetical protein
MNSKPLAVETLSSIARFSLSSEKNQTITSKAAENHAQK